LSARSGQIRLRARPRWRRRAGLRLAFALGLGLLLVSSPNAGRGQVSEQQLKAAFLFKFTQYAEWPSEALGPADAPIRICVLDRAGLAQVLGEAVEGRTAGSRPLVTSLIEGAQEALGCHLLFVGASTGQEVMALLEELTGQPVLTVGDMEGFAQLGGMINLAKQGNRLRFEVNRRAVERAGLQLSSQLLKLASLVGESEEEAD